MRHPPFPQPARDSSRWLPCPSPAAFALLRPSRKAAPGQAYLLAQWWEQERARELLGLGIQGKRNDEEQFRRPQWRLAQLSANAKRQQRSIRARFPRQSQPTTSAFCRTSPRQIIARQALNG